MSDLTALRPDGSQISADLMTVTALRYDGSVNLEWGTTPLTGIPAMRSYSPRQVGDVVLVLRTPAGWRVLGPVGPATTPEVAQDSTVTWGQGPPEGSGWQPGTTTYVRDGQLYVDLTAPPTSTSPSAGVRKVTIEPTTTAAYRDGHRDSSKGGQPRQGAWPSYPHPWSGIWCYGTKIADACQGKTVQKMTMRLSRTRAAHGSSSGVRPAFGLHDKTTPSPSLPQLTGRWSGPPLTHGQIIDSYELPDDVASALASGAKRGIGVSAPTGNQYLIFAACGEITIHYV